MTFPEREKKAFIKSSLGIDAFVRGLVQLESSMHELEVRKLLSYVLARSRDILVSATETVKAFLSLLLELILPIPCNMGLNYL